MNSKRIDIASAQAAFSRAIDTHEQAFGTFFLARLLGFEIDYQDDCCRVGFDTADFMFNPQGTLHGGITALALDVSMGHLLNHLQGPATTLEMKVQYLGPIRGGRVCAEGRLLRRGRGICFLESRLSDAEGALKAHATATWKFLK